jgi:hypothetical protein
MIGTLNPGVGGNGRDNGCGGCDDALHFDSGRDLIFA